MALCVSAQEIRPKLRLCHVTSRDACQLRQSTVCPCSRVRCCWSGSEEQGQIQHDRYLAVYSFQRIAIKSVYAFVDDVSNLQTSIDANWNVQRMIGDQLFQTPHLYTAVQRINRSASSMVYHVSIGHITSKFSINLLFLNVSYVVNSICIRTDCYAKGYITRWNVSISRMISYSPVWVNKHYRPDRLFIHLLGVLEHLSLLPLRFCLPPIAPQ